MRGFTCAPWSTISNSCPATVGHAALDAHCGPPTDRGCFCSKHRTPALQYQDGQTCYRPHVLQLGHGSKVKNPKRICMMLTGSAGLAGEECLSKGGDVSGGDTVMASKNAALLLTELA